MSRHATHHPAPLHSSTLAFADYDPELARLRLAFLDGSRYAYADVPSQLFLALLAAPSHGSFFNRFIRGRFKYVRITGEN